MRFQLRLRPFITLTLVGLITILLLLTVYPIYYGVRSIVLEQTSRLNRDLTYNNYQKMMERLGQVEEIGLSVSTNRGLIRALSHPPTDRYESVVTSRDLNNWLNSLVYIRPYLSSIQVYSDRPIRRVGERIRPLASMLWEHRLDDLQEFDAIWIETRRDKYALLDKRHVLTYAMRIRDTRNASIGFTEVNLSEQALWDTVKGDPEQTPASGRKSVLLGRDNRIMSTFGFASADMASQIPLEEVLSGNAESDIVELEGERYLSVFTQPSPEGWRLVDFIPLEDVYRNVNNLRNLIMLIAGIVLLLTVPVAALLSTKLNRPILRLLSGFKRVETGNFSTRLEPYFIVEFDHLAQNYNSMVEQLHALLKRLEQEHRLKRDVELRLLQSQINPHFLYNTLDMINWMAAIKGAHDVSLMATRLAKLFRISLSKKGPFILLDEELDHAIVYAQIQQARFDDQFEFIDRIPETFKSYYVPRIVLQPFIENAIVHGFHEAMDDKARVIVTARQVNDHSFCLIVEDNGSGLRQDGEERREQLYPSGSGGHGVANVNDRIQLYFGQEYGVTLSANEPCGTRVTILLPIMKSAPEQPDSFAR